MFGETRAPVTTAALNTRTCTKTRKHETPRCSHSCPGASRSASLLVERPAGDASLETPPLKSLATGSTPFALNPADRLLCTGVIRVYVEQALCKHESTKTRFRWFVFSVSRCPLFLQWRFVIESARYRASTKARKLHLACFRVLCFA